MTDADIDTDPFTIRWQVQGHPHGFYYIEVDVFMHYIVPHDETVIHVTQSWLDSHPNEPGTGADCAGYARQYVDGTVVDPDDVYGHPRIERV
jgi:hypothetical protein